MTGRPKRTIEPRGLRTKGKSSKGKGLETASTCEEEMPTKIMTNSGYELCEVYEVDIDDVITSGKPYNFENCFQEHFKKFASISSSWIVFNIRRAKRFSNIVKKKRSRPVAKPTFSYRYVGRESGRNDHVLEIHSGREDLKLQDHILTKSRFFAMLFRVNSVQRLTTSALIAKQERPPECDEFTWHLLGPGFQFQFYFLRWYYHVETEDLAEKEYRALYDDFYNQQPHDKCPLPEQSSDSLTVDAIYVWGCMYLDYIQLCNIMIKNKESPISPMKYLDLMGEYGGTVCAMFRQGKLKDHAARSISSNKFYKLFEGTVFKSAA